eukprot:jgi/Pico_ML_1/54485/g4824.t1
MRPILLKGHERPLTFLKYNKEGDLLVTCAKVVEAHEKPIGDLKISRDGTCFITASQDKFAKLWDIDTLECLKEYNTERPVNACDISPLMDHVLVGGGQEASQVTMTGSRAGKFESKFYHKIFCDELGAVKGHFGPVNAVAYHPDGRSFASGGEDGYVRVHHMDADYFALKTEPRRTRYVRIARRYVEKKKEKEGGAGGHEASLEHFRMYAQFSNKQQQQVRAAFPQIVRGISC